MTLIPKTISLSKAIWSVAFPEGPTEEQYTTLGIEQRRRMMELLPGALEEWTVSGRPADVLEGLKPGKDLSRGYISAQAAVGSDLAEGLRKIGPNVFELMAVASSELSRADEAWQKQQEAEDLLNRAAYAGYVTFRGRPEGTPMGKVPKIHHTYFRHRRLFFYYFDWENKIFPDSGDDDQKGDPAYVEVTVGTRAFENWMREIGKWSKEDGRLDGGAEQADAEHDFSAYKSEIAPAAGIAPYIAEARLRKWFSDYVRDFIRQYDALPDIKVAEEKARQHFAGQYRVQRETARKVYPIVIKPITDIEPRFAMRGRRPPLSSFPSLSSVLQSLGVDQGRSAKD